MRYTRNQWGQINNRITQIQQEITDKYLTEVSGIDLHDLFVPVDIRFSQEVSNIIRGIAELDSIKEIEVGVDNSEINRVTNLMRSMQRDQISSVRLKGVD